MTGSCDGRCCAVFTTSSRLADLIADPSAHQDGDYLLDMLIPLTLEQACERETMFGIPLSSPFSERFTCRHWDEGTRLCTAYESRPAMCRDYPVGECAHGCGCVRAADPGKAKDAVERLMSAAGALA